jgi:hypothetical protein
MAATTPIDLARLEEGVQGVGRDGAFRARLLRALDARFEEVFALVSIDRFGRAEPL